MLVKEKPVRKAPVGSDSGSNFHLIKIRYFKESFFVMFFARKEISLMKQMLATKCTIFLAFSLRLRNT